jgi:hypothetical protein
LVKILLLLLFKNGVAENGMATLKEEKRVG